MTRYQIILAPKNNAEIKRNCPDNSNIIIKDSRIMVARAINDAKKLLLSEGRSGKYVERNALNNVHYLFDESSMRGLIAKLNDGDTLVIHGEGNPFIIGVGLESSAYDLKAIDLANMLRKFLPKDKQLTVEILACLSGVNYEDPKYKITSDNVEYCLNFSQNTSMFLGPEYPLVDIVGFTGNVVVPKNNSGKYTIAAYPDEEVMNNPSKVQKNSSIGQAQRVYNHGELKVGTPTRVLRIAKPKDFGDWATPYIANAFQALNQFLNPKSQSSLSRSSLFAATSETDKTDVTPNPSTVRGIS